MLEKLTSKPKKTKLSRPKTPVSPKNLHQKTALIEVKDENKIVKILILLSSGLLISLVGILLLTINNFSLAKRQSIYVQQIDGTTREAREEDRYYRSDEVIRQTLTTWLYLTWEWDTSLPQTKQKDNGIEIGKPSERLRVPTKTYLASYLMEEGFRQEFLKKIATVIPNSVYQNQINHTTSNLIIYHLGVPKRINKTTYSVNTIFTRVDLENGREKTQTKSSKTFIFQTIEPHQLALKESETNAFRKRLNELLQNGLIISDIKNYSPHNTR